MPASAPLLAASGEAIPGTAPCRLSVVVVAFVGDECLPDCLRHLAQEVRGRDDVEVTVACDDRLTLRPALAAIYPDVRWSLNPGRVHPAVMRARAVRESTGTYVALLEDHCFVAPGWCDAALEACAEGRAIQGGPIAKAEPDTPLNWAGYFLEFSYFMPPAPLDDQRASDCNTTYSRAVLDSVSAAWEREFHETTVNWALADSGVSIFRGARQLVFESHPLQLWNALCEKARFGRTYAMTRCERMLRRSQLVYALGAPVLPAILSVRMGRIAVRHQRLGVFLRAYPWFLMLAVAWMMGEVSGYLRGSRAATA